tara:strand:- start:47 stop:238 length:192 start_codon:yes stop_codon:yes gene_type:complete
MNGKDSINLEKLLSKLNEDRNWILKNIDKGKWSELRLELANLEREMSKFLLRAKEYDSKEKEH